MISSTGSPKVTVIIPSYNRASFIRETVESVLGQIYENIDLVVVDDGSTDGSLEILESYRDRIKLLRHEGGANKGQSASINLGMRSSEGEYIAILDSDDTWAPKKIAIQVEYLQQHPDVGLVYVNEIIIDENGVEQYKIFPSNHLETSDPGAVLLDCYFRVPTNALVRRSVFEVAGEFDESMRSSQDHDMAIRLTEVTKIAFLNEPVSYYRKHKDSLSFTNTRRRWETGFRILEMAAKRYPYKRSTIRHRRAVLNFRLGQCLLLEKKYVHAAARFILAGILDPLRSVKVLLGKENRGGLT